MDLETALELMNEASIPYGLNACVATIDGKNFYVQITHDQVWNYTAEEGGGSEFEFPNQYRLWRMP